MSTILSESAGPDTQPDFVRHMDYAPQAYHDLIAHLEQERAEPPRPAPRPGDGWRVLVGMALSAAIVATLIAFAA